MAVTAQLAPHPTGPACPPMVGRAGHLETWEYVHGGASSTFSLYSVRGRVKASYASGASSERRA